MCFFSTQDTFPYVLNKCFTMFVFNPFPNKSYILRVCGTSLLKTLWEKEKLLVIARNPLFGKGVITEITHETTTCLIALILIWMIAWLNCVFISLPTIFESYHSYIDVWPDFGSTRLWHRSVLPKDIPMKIHCFQRSSKWHLPCYTSHIEPNVISNRDRDYCLTLSQRTNFRLFQTEKVCRWRFQNWWKWQKFLKTG